jgi:hypothetical protein
MSFARARIRRAVLGLVLGDQGDSCCRSCTSSAPPGRALAGRAAPVPHSAAPLRRASTWPCRRSSVPRTVNEDARSGPTRSGSARQRLQGGAGRSTWTSRRNGGSGADLARDEGMRLLRLARGGRPRRPGFEVVARLVNLAPVRAAGTGPADSPAGRHRHRVPRARSASGRGTRRSWTPPGTPTWPRCAGAGVEGHPRRTSCWPAGGQAAAGAVSRASPPRRRRPGAGAPARVRPAYQRPASGSR